MDAFSVMMASSKAIHRQEMKQECFGAAMRVKRSENVGSGQCCCALCQAQGRTTVVPDSSRCFFCEKPCCSSPSCSAICQDCGERFCTSCSTIEFVLVHVLMVKMPIM